ncbi:MAG: glycerol-3-phosphate 1-O-acyltransferase PlsY [Candidatus Omnitrophica bacterium]|nr:glycerol-3-phosphate 1-O-acyltransferase PlsY [Candidatus Omnitrophota bacterium]
MFNTGFAVITAYLIGSLPTSFIVARTRSIDIRKYGSGNVGATNVLRVIGKWPALFVLAVDIIKGAFVVTLMSNFFYERGVPFSLYAFNAILGLSVVSGHVWSIFLSFKGGKGVATGIGVLAALMPKTTFIGLLVFLIAFMKTRYVSVSSLFLCVTIPFAAAFTGKNIEYIILSVTLCIIISYRHKSNLKRLLSGDESKISF